MPGNSWYLKKPSLLFPLVLCMEAGVELLADQARLQQGGYCCGAAGLKLMTCKAPARWDLVQQNQILTPHWHGQVESQFLTFGLLDSVGMAAPRKGLQSGLVSVLLTWQTLMLGQVDTHESICVLLCLLSQDPEANFQFVALSLFFLNTPKLNSW